MVITAGGWGVFVDVIELGEESRGGTCKAVIEISGWGESGWESMRSVEFGLEPTGILNFPFNHPR
jgi:hypothetical protein